MSPQPIDFSQYETKQPIDFSKYEAKPEPSAASRLGSNFLSGLGITSDEQAKQFFTHPIKTFMDSIEAQGDLAKKAKEAYDKGDYMGAVQHGLNYLLPFIGQQTDQAGNQLKTGDIAGGIGRTLGAAVPIAAASPEVRAGAGAAAEAVADKGAAAVRAGARGANKVLQEFPGSIGTTAGAALGRATGVPGGTEIGGAAGYAIGNEVLPKVRIPGEGFGFPSRVIGGPAAAPPFSPTDPGAPFPEHPGTFPGAPFPEKLSVYPGAPLPEHPGTFPGAPLPATPPQELLQARNLGKVPPQPPPEAAALRSVPAPVAEAGAATATSAEPPLAPSVGAGESIPRTLSGDSALRKILTGQDNANLLKIARSRGINVTKEAQLKPGAADSQIISKIIDDFSPEELDSLRNQYLENTRMGKHNFGDIGAEAQKTLGLQAYFPDLKIPQAVLNRTQLAIGKARGAASAVAATPAPEEDLTGILQNSLEAARKKRIATLTQ